MLSDVKLKYLTWPEEWGREIEAEIVSEIRRFCILCVSTIFDFDVVFFSFFLFSSFRMAETSASAGVHRPFSGPPVPSGTAFLCVTWFTTCHTSSFCTVAWQLARFQLTRRIARSLSDSWVCFYRAMLYVSAVLGMGLCLSVCVCHKSPLEFY